MRRSLGAMGLFDRIVPDDALSGFAHVGWRKVGRLREVAITAAGGLCAPVAVISWYDAHDWVRWPSLGYLLPVVRAPRGRIAYITPPAEPGRPANLGPVLGMEDLLRGPDDARR